jgi:ribosomal protein S18 acetylase RimI-like enzyme
LAARRLELIAMSVRIRVCSAKDYAAVVDVHNRAYPGRATTVKALAESERARDPRYKHRRWVAVQGARVVGYAAYGQPVYGYRPNKFAVDVAVLPAYRRRGIGAALYDQLEAGLAALKPQTLRADAYGNLPEGVQFLEQRGFREVFRETPMHLEVATFDATPYADLEERLRALGIQVRTLSDLAKDPGRDRKTYDLYWEVTEDVPREGELDVMPFPEWAKWTLKDPLVPHDGYVISVCGDQYIGLAEFGIKPGSDVLQGGLVGVKQAFRRKGVALAMHVHAIAYARAHGYARIVTSTAVVNVGMRALYERLGFVRQPDWIQMERVCVAARNGSQ